MVSIARSLLRRALRTLAGGEVAAHGTAAHGTAITIEPIQPHSLEPFLTGNGPARPGSIADQ